MKSRYIQRGSNKTMGIARDFRETSQRISLGTLREFPRNVPQPLKGLHESIKYQWYLKHLHAFRTL